ncbi:tetratricopeptide repeat-containing sensor histidine kinase [Flavobacterium sp.]|uniref:ATP-binding protein n=1 Tax=Flavobacterium sp. TaxID=239 RepID=UPI002488C36E|nr:tetratricopeptide repeat-containing sensor histidine kinase [Flavobacterium sp.]MDI1315783.1 hypothetical protein [Flavobacterium sp.]
MAWIQKLFSDFSGSESTATEAYKNAEGPLYLPYIYNALALVYKEQYNYDEALKYYNKSYNKSLSNSEKCTIRNNIAVVYLAKKEFNTAIKILYKNIENDSLKKDKTIYAKSLDNLGYALLKTKNSKGFDCLKQSERLRDSLNNDFEKIPSYIHLSEFYQENNQKLAFDFAQKAYQAATRINSPDDRIEALKFCIINAEPINIKALAVHQMQLSDSINRVRSSAKNQFAKIKYDSSKAIKEKENTEKEKQQVSFLFIGIILILLLIIFLVRFFNRRKFKNSVYTTETRIAKKIHDELANDVFKAMNYAENQDLQNPDKKEILLQNLDDLYTRTRNISQTNSEIETGEEYKDFLIQLLNSFSNENVNVIINNSSSIDWLKLKKEIKIAVYRVLQELMVNMKKHSESSVVIISFEHDTKSIQIKYSDNGKGIVQLENHKKGLHNAENRIHAIKGTITFETESGKGFKTKIIIPK